MHCFLQNTRQSLQNLLRADCTLPLACLILGLCSAEFIAYAFYYIPLPIDLINPEGALAYSIDGLLNGTRALYRDFRIPPYSTTPYTPLFYLISSFLGLFTDHSINAIYTCGRVLCFFSSIMSAFFASRLFIISGGDRKFQAVALMLPFTILVLRPWGFVLRPDMLALALSLMGALLFFSEHRFRIALAALVLAFAWWSKQSYISAAAAIICMLFTQQRWRECMQFIGVYLASLLLLGGCTQIASHGLFFPNIFIANLTSLQTSRWGEMLIDGLLYGGATVEWLGAAGIALLFKQKIGNSRLRFLLFYAYISFALNIAGCMKEGSDYNYWLEPLFVLSVFASWGFSLLYQYNKWRGPLVLLMAASIGLPLWGSPTHFDRGMWENQRLSPNAAQAEIDTISSLQGKVLILNEGLALRSEKPLFLVDAFNARYLEELDQINTATLANQINHKTFLLLVFDHWRQPNESWWWPRQILQAIRSNYEPCKDLFQLSLWCPKKANSRLKPKRSFLYKKIHRHAKSNPVMPSQQASLN